MIDPKEKITPITDPRAAERFEEIGASLMEEVAQMLPFPLNVLAAQWLPSVKAAMLTEEGKQTLQQLMEKIAYIYGYKVVFVPDEYPYASENIYPIDDIDIPEDMTAEAGD